MTSLLGSGSPCELPSPSQLNPKSSPVDLAGHLTSPSDRSHPPSCQHPSSSIYLKCSSSKNPMIHSFAFFRPLLNVCLSERRPLTIPYKKPPFPKSSPLLAPSPLPCSFFSPHYCCLPCDIFICDCLPSSRMNVSSVRVSICSVHCYLPGARLAPTMICGKNELGT